MRRLDLNLSSEASARLRGQAKARGRTVAEVLRRALNIEDFLRHEEEQGKEICLRYPDGRAVKLTFDQ